MSFSRSEFERELERRAELEPNLTKAPLADIGIVGISSTYLGLRIYIVVSKGACLIETQQYSIV